MILINKNQNNYITVTLQEKTTLDTPYYLFKFKNDVQGNVVRFTAQDISAYPDRFNQFLITETSGTTNLTSGVIELEPAGFWTYTIFEQSSSTNLDESSTTSVVEVGKVRVVGSITNYQKYGEARTYTSYDGS